MIHARLDPITGFLYEFTHREPTYPDDVPVDAMPSGSGPWTYDAVNRLAVPDAAGAVAILRDVAKAVFAASDGDTQPLAKACRAFALLVLDELNAHAVKMNAVLTAIDTGANLTAVKANIAAIADYPARTAAQLKQAIRDKIDAGDADA